MTLNQKEQTRRTVLTSAIAAQLPIGQAAEILRLSELQGVSSQLENRTS